MLSFSHSLRQRNRQIEALHPTLCLLRLGSGSLLLLVVLLLALEGCLRQELNQRGGHSQCTLRLERVEEGLGHGEGGGGLRLKTLQALGKRRSRHNYRGIGSGSGLSSDSGGGSRKRSIDGGDVCRGEETGDLRGVARGQKEDGHLDVRHELGVVATLLEDGVRHQELVVHALTDTHAGAGLVREGADRERQGGETLVDDVEELARGLVAERVLLLDCTLVDSGAGTSLSGLAIASRHGNVDGVDLAGLEGAGINLVLGLVLQQDHLVAVDDVLLHLVHQSTGDRVDLEGIGDALDGSRDLVVRVARLHHAHGDLSSSVGGREHVVALGDIGGGKILLTGDSDGVGNDGDEAIDVNTKIDLDKVLGSQRRELREQKEDNN